MKAIPRLLVVTLVAIVTSAHVGDTNTHFRGRAGPYPVQVTVRHPGVVPGLAQIAIRVDGEGVRGVMVRPVPAMLGLEGAPRADEAQPVPGEPGLYAAELWFMTSGSYSVHVTVDGMQGGGTVIVPVASIATRTLDLGSGLAILLILLGILLAAGLVTIVRAAVRDSVLARGELPDPRGVRRGRIASAVAVVVIVLLLTGGRAWWNAEDGAYRARLFDPLDVQATVDDAAGTLRLEIVDSDWLEGDFSPLVPDHGKMMHTFLVRIPDQDAFAHVHPQRRQGNAFLNPLPPLPAGEYALYADVVHESGFAQTLTDTVHITSPIAPDTAVDADDSSWAGTPAVLPVSGAGGTVTFPDSTALALMIEPATPLEADRDVLLRFRAREADGSATPLEPYMGMAAHAAVRRDDGAVFVHLHPSGSVAPAAIRQVTLVETPPEPQDSQHDTVIGRQDTVALTVDTALADTTLADTTPATHPDTTHPADTTPVPPTDTAHASPAASLDPDGTVTIPYVFPRPGSYHLFVQTRRNGVVRTAVFALDVAAPASR